MNSLGFIRPGVFILPSILKDIFTVEFSVPVFYSNTLTTLTHRLLACIVSEAKPAIVFIFVPLSAFRIFS